MLDVERALVDPCIENSLPGLLLPYGMGHRPISGSSRVGEAAVGAFRVDITTLVRDLTTRAGAEARPQRRHLATHVVQLLQAHIHDVFE